MQMSQKSKKFSRGKFIGLVILLCAALVLAGVFLMTGQESADAPASSPGLIYDDAAIEGGWESLSREEIEETLNQQVEKGYVNISMNASPIFADGQAQGSLMIVARFVSY